MRKDMCIVGDCSIIEAMRIIDSGGAGVAFAIDSIGYLQGVLTDGDIRKAMLNGADLTTPISRVINKNFIFGKDGQSQLTYINILKKKRRRQLPIIDEKGILVDIFILDDVSFARIDIPVVLMVGGLGSRLGDLTSNCPKPMLKVGNKPILEHIVEGFVRQGFFRFFMCVNYKAEMIKDFFGDGTDWGIEISYTEEKKRLGTAGAINLIKEYVNSHMIVMNGDVMTNLDYKSLLEFHLQQECSATIAVREYEVGIAYGVVEVDDLVVKGIKEKPIHRFPVNAGIYVLDKFCLSYIPADTYFDMTTLLDRLIENQHKVTAFSINDYWIDIGKIEDYKKANVEIGIHYCE